VKRNMIYSGLVFGLLFSWVISGAITQLFMGVLSSSDLGFVLAFSFFMSAVVAAIFFVVIRAIRNKFFGGTVQAGYRPTAKFAVVAGTLLTVCIVGSVTQSYFVGKEKAEAARAEAQRKEAAAKALAERQEKEKQRLAAMTPEQRDSEIRKKEEASVAPIIHEGEAMVKRWREREAWGAATLAGKKLKQPDSKPVTKTEWADVKTHLSSIKPTQPQYQKAQALLSTMAEEDKKGAAADAAFQATAKIEARKDFAENLEKVFIEKRMNTDVTASGPKNTILKIKWVLASKVTANDLSKSGVVERAEKAGFKKLVFTDGYNSQWTWDLKPSVE
jgi:hypothetical protein